VCYCIVDVKGGFEFSSVLLTLTSRNFVSVFLVFILDHVRAVIVPGSLGTIGKKCSLHCSRFDLYNGPILDIHMDHHVRAAIVPALSVQLP
jgi:hypothetical protein